MGGSLFYFQRGFMTTISLPHLNSAVDVISLSATVAQKEAAKYLLGKNYLKILESIEKLSKSKIVLSPNLRGFLLMLRDAEDDEIIKFQKLASGKATIKAMQDLLKAKTLETSLKALSGIKVAKKWQEAAGKTKNVVKPVPKVKPPKEPKVAPVSEPAPAPPKTQDKPITMSWPEVPDRDKKPIQAHTVNIAVRILVKLGLTVNDHDIVKTPRGSTMIVLQPKKDDPKLSWALQIHGDGKFSHGAYNEKGVGTEFQDNVNLANACMRLKAAIDKQNAGNNTTAGTAPKKTELALIDEISDVMPQTLAKNTDKYADHFNAIAQNLCRNIPGLKCHVKGAGMELTYGSGAFGTLTFEKERWTLTPYQRTHAIKDIGQFYDAGHVIDTLLEMFAIDKNKVSKQKAVGTMNTKLLRAKEELMSMIATSSLKVFDEVPVPNLTDNETIVWDCTYKMPTGVSLPIRLRFNSKSGFSFALNNHPAFKVLTPGIAHNTHKFVKGLVSTVANFVASSSKRYVLVDGRAYNPEPETVIMTFDKKCELRITGNSIFLTGAPATVGAIYQSRFRNALDNSDGAATLDIIAPNNFKIACRTAQVRDKVMLDAMIIQKV